MSVRARVLPHRVVTGFMAGHPAAVLYAPSTPPSPRTPPPVKVPSPRTSPLPKCRCAGCSGLPRSLGDVAILFFIPFPIN